MNSTLAAPGQLNFWHVFFHELLTLEEAADLLDDIHRRSVITLAEEGKLRAVNIAAKTSTAEDEEAEARRYLRVWRYSVEWLGESERRRVRMPVHPAIETLLPHHRANFRCGEVQDFLRCSENHVYGLLRMGAFDGPQFSSRQNRIARGALVAFLQAREIGAH